MTGRSLPDVARELERRDQFTIARARVLQLAADPERPERYKCSHPDMAGHGWSHPWPDEEMYPHPCCRRVEHCPAEWTR